MERLAIMIDSIINFFSHPFFSIVGGVSIIIMISGFIYTVYLIIAGVFPVWYRLGSGLSSRRIALFADADFDNLKNMLVDSNIFKEKNILRVNNNDIRKAQNETIFLIHWNDYKSHIDDILNIKRDSTALIIYAPQHEGRIDEGDMKKINNQRNAVVVNFRGRLLNDILTSLITTSYDKR